MIPVDITNREEAYAWLLRHGYSVDVAKEELENWHGDVGIAYDEDGEEYEEEVVELEALEDECEDCNTTPCECDTIEDDEEEEDYGEDDDEEEDYDEDDTSNVEH